jgi:hypothetical protein
METLKDEMTQLFSTFLPGQVGSRFSRLIALEQEQPSARKAPSG